MQHLHAHGRFRGDADFGLHVRRSSGYNVGLLDRHAHHAERIFRRSTDSCELVVMLVAVNNGMQCFGLIVVMPLLLKFLSLRHVWLHSLIMALVSWKGHAIVTDVLQMVVCSFLTPSSAHSFGEIHGVARSHWRVAADCFNSR